MGEIEDGNPGIFKPKSSVNKSSKAHQNSFVNNLVGPANEHSVSVNGRTFKCLLDSGSMVSTISQSAFETLNPKVTMKPLDSLGLTLSVADGSSLKYSGYFEATICVPFLSSFILDIPILVIPDNDFNLSCPVKVCGNKSVKVAPFESTTLSGMARNLDQSISSVVTESPEIFQGYTVCPRVIRTQNAVSAKISVRICNMTAKTLTIKPKSEICTITEAKVIDDISSFISPEIPSEPPIRKFQLILPI